MDYLKSFIIGSSGLVFFQHLALLSLIPGKYEIPYKLYSFILPTYYGVMNMLALLIGKKFDLSLQLRLFIISIISPIFVLLINIFYSRRHYKPYKNFKLNEWIAYFLTNGSRHLIAFNIVAYFFEKYFDYLPLKIFIIGSSSLSFLMTYLKVILVEDKTNYDYKLFAPLEPFIQGFDLLISLYIFHYILKYNIKDSLGLWSVSSSILWFILAYTRKTYKYKGSEWINPFIRILVTGIFKAYLFDYLIKNV